MYTLKSVPVSNKSNRKIITILLIMLLCNSSMVCTDLQQKSSSGINSFTCEAYIKMNYMLRGTSRQQSGKAQTERNSDSKNGGGKNQTDNKVLIHRKHIVSRVSSCFPIGGHSVTRT